MPRTAACALVWLPEQKIYALHGLDEEDLWGGERADCFERLAEHASFAFRGRQGHLTLRRERRQRGGEGYWYAYRNDGRKTLKRYAGRTADLSIERLEELAAYFAATLEQPSNRRSQHNVSVERLVDQREDGGQAPSFSEREQVSPGQRGNGFARVPGRLPGVQEDMLPLLAPKLNRPRLSVGLVERQALLNRLDRGLGQGLTLLCAPAGFGKTTLVSQWLARLNAVEHTPTAWVALDSGDNDPVRFWSYIIAACQMLDSRMSGAALAHLNSREGVPFEQHALDVSLTLLLNEANQATTQSVLVLEDYHVITEPQIHTTLTYLLEHLPPSLHVVLITRTEPPLGLARKRTRSELNELGATELRFSAAEMRAFLTQTLAIEPSSEIMNRLEALFEGWVTGLRLLALTLQGERSTQALEQCLAAFSNGQRYLLEYFSSEVLNAQTEQVQQFLLQTCPFYGLSASFCAAVTGSQDSERILSELERANLFLLPLAGQERWYRYHPLFAEALRYEARRRLSEDVRRECFLRASCWYEQHNRQAEAIEAALQACDFARAADLIEQMTGPQRFHEMREHYTLQRWLLALPTATLQSYPTLSLLLAMVHLFTTDCQKELSAQVLTRAEQALHVAERVWQAEENRPGLGEALAFRVVMARFQGNFTSATHLARQALAWLAPDARQWRATCLGTLGEDELRAGRLDAARQNFQEAYASFKAAGNHYGQRVALLALAEIGIYQGRLRESEALYQEVLASTNDDLSDQAQALLGLAALDYEWNELASAESRAQAALSMGERIGAEKLQLQAAFLLGQVQCARGQIALARQQFSALMARAQTRLSPLLYHQTRAREARLQLLADDLDGATRWLRWQNAQTTALPLVQQEQEKLLIARLLIAQDQAGTATALLATIRHAAHQQERVHDEIEALLQTALAFHAQSKPEQARSALSDALALAHGEGYTRLFLDEGERVAEMLRAFSLVEQKRHLAIYARTLLRAFSSLSTEQDVLSKSNVELFPPTIKPLSPQEQRVLRFLAHGYSNQEIAQKLVVSPNTVKSQVQSIYCKLNVHSRQEVRQIMYTYRAGSSLAQ